DRSEEEQGGATAQRGSCVGITPHVLPLQQPSEPQLQQFTGSSLRGAKDSRDQRAFLAVHVDKERSGRRIAANQFLVLIPAGQGQAQMAIGIGGECLEATVKFGLIDQRDQPAGGGTLFWIGSIDNREQRFARRYASG